MILGEELISDNKERKKQGLVVNLNGIEIGRTRSWPAPGPEMSSRVSHPE
jgi:hypothetical protein